MSPEAEKPSSPQDGVRSSLHVINRTFLSHYRHLKKGERRRKGCTICKVGLGATPQTFEVKPAEQPKPDVVQSNGDDVKGSTTPSPPSWWDR